MADSLTILTVTPKHVGVAADHGGFELKEKLITALKAAGFTVKDFGAYQLELEDDYPDFVIPLAKAVAKGEIEKGLAICGSGIGACVAANKVAGVRASMIMDSFSAHQGVEDDNMNIMCLGGRIIGFELAWSLVQIFLNARFSDIPRHRHRLAKVVELEHKEVIS
ncbi:MAG: RpiB/LacA/LacB family sugar-phosphate isomerase [Planctomycetaceae bacterium]|nr:RpiB/LacA/LacB family sugar-phosphate isomerase [Planctomycetaceae bacterium]